MSDQLPWEIESATPPSFALDLDCDGGARQVSIAEAFRRRDVWINVPTRSDSGDTSVLKSHLEFDAFMALTADETRPRVAVVAGGLLLVVRGINLNAGADPEDMVSLRMWFDDSRLLTVQRRCLMAVRDLAEDLNAGHGTKSPAALMLALVERLIDRMSPLLEELDEHVDQLEDASLTEPPSKILHELAQHRRRAIALRRHIAPTRDALSQLAVLAPEHLGPGSEWTARELADQVARYVDDLDEVRDRAAIAHEFIMSRQSDMLNQRMLLLSIAAAIFLPLGLISGMMGMNVGDLPLTGDNGFWITTAIIFGVGGLLAGAMKLVRWY
jgi:zinc transporter